MKIPQILKHAHYCTPVNSVCAFEITESIWLDSWPWFSIYVWSLSSNSNCSLGVRLLMTKAKIVPTDTLYIYIHQSHFNQLHMCAYLDKAVVIHVSKQSHQKLTIHSIRQTTVTRYALSKIFNLECSLYCTSKEAPKGCDKRCKASHDKSV